MSDAAKWLNEWRPEIGHWLWQDMVCLMTFTRDMTLAFVCS